jgi:hypothetical protein
VFEDGRKGLGLRISPRGGKSCVFDYRRNGKLSRIKVMRVASFFPFQTTYWLNGHSFMEQELNRAQVGFRKNNNAFLAVDDVKALQATADRLSPEIIRERLDYWTLILGPKFSHKGRKGMNLRSRAGGTSKPRTSRAETWWPSSMISSTVDRRSFVRYRSGVGSESSPTPSAGQRRHPSPWPLTPDSRRSAWFGSSAIVLAACLISATAAGQETDQPVGAGRDCRRARRRDVFHEVRERDGAEVR